MIVLGRAPIVERYPTSLNDIVFQHHSPYELTQIVPQTYDAIFEYRSLDLGTARSMTYVKDRIDEEDSYRQLLKNSDVLSSFTYATVVDHNLMEDPASYPGFTYFFKLSHREVNECLFGIVAQDKRFSVPVKKGFNSLNTCLTRWQDSLNELKSYVDPVIGLVEPRIEVVIPFTVTPFAVVPEVERRQTNS